MNKFTVALSTPAHEMAQEEILKQVPFVSKEITETYFSADGLQLHFSAPIHRGAELTNLVQALAARTQRTLRSLQRKVAFRSSAMDNPRFFDNPLSKEVHFLGKGQVALEGLPLALFRYFDRVFEDFGSPFKAAPLLTPTLIPSKILARCDYFRSFPQSVTFATHLKEESEVIDAFRVRHQHADEVDNAAMADMDPPEACLSPAVCYHVYHLYEGQTIPPFGVVRGICGKCFRFESNNFSDLRRLWDFTLREVVFLGGRDEVLAAKDQTVDMMADFLQSHRLAGEIRTASDPFFVAPESASKSYFQLSSESKFEISLLLQNGERLAVGSHNYHSDFFGRVFNVNVEGAGAMHSVCIGFGLERWVYAFLQQHGDELSRWPDVIRNAPEFAAYLSPSA